MRVLVWLLCIALALAMPSGIAPAARTSRTSSRTRANSEGGELSPVDTTDRVRRALYGAKAYTMHKVIGATKDAGLDSILDPSAGRLIWRATREKLFQVPNQVGGGLGDYVIQAAIGAKKPLMAIARLLSRSPVCCCLQNPLAHEGEPRFLIAR